MKTKAESICDHITRLAGLRWSGGLQVGIGAVLPPNPPSHDLFLDAVGRWDAVSEKITLDLKRCSSELLWPANALQEVALVHFCARAVVHLGVHPETGQTYGDWDAPAKRFASEGYPLLPNHPLYDPLVREQTLFTQIFTCLYLQSRGLQDELEVFERLSKGHCALYELNYDGTPDSHRVDPMLRCNWERAADADAEATARKAAAVLGMLTRGEPLKESNLDLFDFDS